MRIFFGQQKLPVLFKYMLLVPIQKSALKSKDFFTFCAHPSFEKRIYFQRFLSLKLQLQKLQKAGQDHAQAAEDGSGQQGTVDPQLLKASRLTCS